MHPLLHTRGVVPDVAARLLDKNQLTVTNTLKRAFPFVLLCAYGLFTCGYFFLADFNDHYRFFARFVFVLGLFVLVPGIRENYRHPVFQAIGLYTIYFLLSGFWAAPVEWYGLGQKFTISVYLLSFITITSFLVHWNRLLFERMLQLCVLIAAAAALVSLVVFYRDNPFPNTRLIGIGALSNVNEFSNVYGVFGLLAMGFALRTRKLPFRLLLFGAIAIFISYAWFGQSRTAFVSMIIALITLAGLTLEKKNRLHVAIIVPVMVGVALVIIFPAPSEEALSRGMGLRPQIWGGTWNEAMLAPIAGHGLTSDIAVKIHNNIFETPHNGYLQAFWHGGAIGLSLLLLLLAIAFRHAFSLGREQGDYTVFSMLVFVTCTMMTGVDSLIGRPRDQWMLFWFPLALLLSYQAVKLRSAPPLKPRSLGSTERAK
jgi:O-antigen ligase